MARRIVSGHAHPAPRPVRKALEGMEAFGLDETVMGHPGSSPCTPTSPALVDLDRAQLLDIALGRSGPVVEHWLDQRDDDWRAGIEVLVALDPFRGYANGLLAQLGYTTVAFDHFHAVRLVNAAVGDVRRRVQQETDPLYGIRRLLLVGAKRLDERGRSRIAARLAAGDRFDEVAATWTAKDLLGRSLAPTAGRSPSALVAFYRSCAEAGVPEASGLPRHSAWCSSTTPSGCERAHRGGQPPHREAPPHRP